MPSFRSSKSNVKRKGDMVDTFDHANIDDFFNQPSAHELTAASERRVEEIMIELSRRTIEELENWSHASYVEEISRGSQKQDQIYYSTPKKETSPEIDVVSPPAPSLPYLSSLATASDTNCPAALSTKSKIFTKFKDHISILQQPDVSSPESKLLPAPNRRSERQREMTMRARGAGNEVSASSMPSPLPPSTSTPTLRPTYLSPASIVPKDFAYDHQAARSEGSSSPSLQCSKPLPAIPVTSEQHTTQASLTHLPSRSMIPTIVITPPPARKHGLRTSSVTQVTRKALPSSSPLLVQSERRPAYV